MSNLNYNVKWKATLNELMINMHLEDKPRKENEEEFGMKHVRKDAEWFYYYTLLYIRYVNAYKQLEDIYDQLTHPQKRVLLKDFLQNTMLRMVQVKRSLVFYNVDTLALRSEYPNLDNILMELKLNPTVLDIPVPRFFREENFKERDKRNQMIDKLLLQFHDTNQPEEEVIEERFALEANIETAVRIIQKNERGRQGIERALMAKTLRKHEIKKNDRRLKMAEGIEFQEESEREDAVLVIQKYFRGYKAREQIWFMRQVEMEFLGMTKKDLDPNDKNSELYKFNSKRIGFKNLQQEQEKTYKKAVDELKQEYADLWSDDIKDKMLEERRVWIRDHLEQHEFKDLPRSAKDYYEKDKVKPPLSPEEEEAQRIEMEQKAKDKKKKKDDKKKGAGKKGKKGKKSEDEVFKKERTVQGPSEAVQKLQENIEKHQKEWMHKNEQENFEQQHDPEIVKNNVMPEIEENVKTLVDEIIDIELGNLRMKYKLKKKKKKGGKKKKKKAKKAKKVPGARLCKNRDPRDMLAELVEAGIVKKLMPARLDDLRGEPNYLRIRQEQMTLADKDIPSQPDPSLWELRNYLAENIAIPLGSEYVRENLERGTFINFFGPHGSGKTLAVRALAYETDAMVVDLSPSTIENQYPDKNSTAKMLYMAFTVAKKYQPAIIYIDEIEEIFKAGKKKKKKKVGDVAGGPNFARLKKPLEAFKKAKYIKKEDRVAVITCTSKPWGVNKKVLKKFCEKKVYFPYPNYGTRKGLFQYFLEQKGFQIPNNFPLSTLAHVTEGFTGGNFKEAIAKVITERRLMQLIERPLTVSEFIGPLSNQPITYQQEYAKFREFFDDMSGVKAKRTKKLAPPEDENDKKGDKKKKKK